MPRHTMLDLETWGTTPGSAIRSIGACMFRPVSTLDFNDERITGPTFYANISAESCKAVGLTFQESTVEWWKTQSAEAQQALLADQKELGDVLWDFSAWFEQQGGELIWSNGANFDQPLLEACYRAVGMQAPWQFYHSRCTRTLYDLGQVNHKMWPRAGVAHNALDDAIHQARCCAMAAGRLFPVPLPDRIQRIVEQELEKQKLIDEGLPV